LPRVAVTAAMQGPVSEKRGEAARRGHSEQPGRRLAGTLVHRLFERHGIALSPDALAPVALAPVVSGFSRTDPITDELQRLIRDEEAADVQDRDALLTHAREAYIALCGAPALVTALTKGDALFEVPFSLRAANSQMILRGTFDCLVRQADGSVSVLELKTGKRMPEHQEQLTTYLAAAHALFPGTAVEATLVYVRDSHLHDWPLD
jgi:ATP-dependent exoDNAse (exonuclease V) beta subunit